MLYNIFLLGMGWNLKPCLQVVKKITENFNRNLLISVLKRTNLKKVVFKKIYFLN